MGFSGGGGWTVWVGKQPRERERERCEIIIKYKTRVTFVFTWLL